MTGRIVVGASSRADPGVEVPVVRTMADDNRGGDAPRAAERTRELLGQRTAA